MTSLIPDDQLKEATIFAALQAWDKAILSGPQVGSICRTVRDEMLWQYRDDPQTGLPCRSWTRWMQLAAPGAYSTAHGHLADVMRLSDIPDEHLSQIRSENVDTVIQLSTAVRKDPEVLEAAKSQRSEEFIEHIREKHPDQHVETRRALKLSPTPTALKVINEGLEVGMRDGSTREQVVEKWAVNELMEYQMEQEVERAHQDTPSVE